MGHDLYLDKCYFGREPGWHSLGNVNEEGLTATEALRQFQIETEYFERLYYFRDGAAIESPFGMMVRNDPGALYGFSEVSDLPLRATWHNLPFDTIAKCWDEGGMPVVDTLGVLGSKKGNRLFITVKLPTVGIAGDEFVPYILWLYSLDGRTAHNYGYTFVRVVCANTVAMALSEGFTLKVRKNSNLLEDLPKWLRGAWESSEDRLTAHAAAVSTLTHLDMTEQMVQEALEVAVPVGNLILTGNREYDDLREKRYEQQLLIADRNRAQVLERYNSDDETAIMSVGNRWTAYHFYMAYIEWADHFAPARDDKNRAMSALVGAHAAHKANLAKHLLKLAKIE